MPSRRLRIVASVIATATIGVSLPIVAAAPAGASQAGVPTVYGWGYGAQGEIADGSTAVHLDPSGMTQIPDQYFDGQANQLLPVKPASIVGGFDNAVMMTTTGQVFSWGGNTHEESYGNSAVAGNATIPPTYIDLAGSFGGRTATKVGTSQNSTSYALLNNGGWLVGWGSNTNNLLGGGSTPSAPRLITQGVLDFGCGSDSCLAVKSKAGGGTELWGWGSGANGTFGEGGGTSHATPTLLTTAITNPVEVGGGNRFAVVLDAAGVVHSMGVNTNGELGDGTTNGSSSPVTVKFPTGTPPIAHIFVGVFSSYAIDTSGQLWSWGYGGNGALGTGFSDSPAPQKVSTDLNGNSLGTVTKVAIGWGSAAILNSAGVVFNLGANTTGELGSGELAGSIAVPRHLVLPRPAIDVAYTSDTTNRTGFAILSDPSTTPMTRTDGTIIANYSNTATTDPNLYQPYSQIVESDGTGANQVVLNPEGQRQNLYPAISPDGTRVAYASTQSISDPSSTGADLYVSSLESTNVFGSTLKTAAHVHNANLYDPVWTHTTNALVYASDEAANADPLNLWAVDLGTSTQTRLTSGNLFDRHPTISPDDAHIVFTRGTRFSTSTELYIGDFNPGGPSLTNITRLTNNSITDTNAAYSPDGKYLAWVEGTSGGAINLKLMVAPINGHSLGTPVQRATDLSNAMSPAWSPDGSHLAVAGADNHGVGDVYIYDTTTWQRSAGPIYGGKYGNVYSATWGANLNITSSPLAVASPFSVPLSSLNQNGASPAVTGCSTPATCGNVGSAPGHNPGALPGNNPGRLPGHNPGALPGHNPGALPGNNPGRLPGMNPGVLPGNNPGQLPGNNPGGLPGNNPGRLPGHNPGALPGNNPGRLGLIDLAWTTDADQLGTNPLIKAGLQKIRLIDIAVGNGWDYYLKNTPLEDKRLDSLTLYDLLSLNPVPNIPIGDMDLSNSPLGEVSLASFLLGDTRLEDMTLHAPETWCNDLLAYLHRIGSPLSCDAYGQRGPNGEIISGGFAKASLIGLEIAGIPLDAFPGLDDLTLGDIDFEPHDGWLAEYPLSGIDLLHSAIGNVLIKTLPHESAKDPDDPSDPGPSNDPTSKFYLAPIDCSLSQIDCTSETMTLFGAASQAARDGAQTVFRNNASIANLAGSGADNVTLSATIMSIAENLVGDPTDQVSLDDLGYTSAAAGASNFNASSTITYAPAGVQGIINPVTVSVTMPAGFTYLPNSSNLSVDGGSSSPTTDPTVNGQQLSWHFGTIAGSRFAISFAQSTERTLGTYSYTGLSIQTADLSEAEGHADGAIPIVQQTAIDTSTPTTPYPIAADQAYAGYITKPGQSLYFAINAPIGGSQLDVFLDHLPIDADLLVYHPSNIDATTPLRPIPADAPKQVDATADEVLGPASQAESLTKQSEDDYPVANRPLAGVSDNRGLQFEHVGVLTLPATGKRYLIQVTGHGTATSTQPFLLRATVTPPNGLPDVARKPFPNTGTAGTAPTTADPSTQTLILTNEQRLQQIYGSSRAALAINAMNQLAATSSLHALVVPVEGWSDVAQDYAAWDATPGEPELANNIVRDINAHVDALLGTNRSSLRNIVLGGTDEVIPMARLADQTESSNERGFSSDVGAMTRTATGGNNALLASEAAGYVLSDDPYGSFAPRAILGSYLYPPNVALGRLVETPEDIQTVINQFLADHEGNAYGVLHPHTGLAAGYDFFQKLADNVQQSLSQTLGTNVPELSGFWTRDQLKTAYSDANPVPDIAGIVGHATPTYLVPGDQLTTFPTSQLASTNLANKILFTLGCHSGFNVTDYLSSVGSVADFPQVTESKGIAAFIGQTGYGLASRTDTLQWGEKVLTNFAHDMTGRTLGQALAQAKLDYLGNDPSVYDAKALEEATYYGLPMFSIGGPDNDTPPAAPPTATDAPTGLTSVPLTLDNPIGGTDNWHLNGTTDGSYYTLSNQIQGSNGLTAVEQHRPIEPRVDVNVSQPGLSARGVLVTALSSQDDGQFDPVLARPVVESSQNEPEQQVADVTWPLHPQGLSTVPELSGGIRQTASFTLGRFRSTGIGLSGPSAGKTIGVQRRYTHLAASVLFTQQGTPTSNAPVVGSTTVTAAGAGSRFTVTPIADTGRTIKRVLVLVHLNGTNGAWTPIDLVQQADGSWTNTTSLGGQYLEYVLQAVDDQGDVGVTTGTGAVYDPGNNANDPGAISSSLSISVGSAPLGAPVPVTFTVTSSSPIGVHGTATASDGNGGSCTATITDGTGTCNLTPGAVGQFSVSASFDGANSYSSSSATGSGTVTPAPLTITASSGTTAYGTAPSVTASYSGFVLGDDASALDHQPACSSTATAASAPGTYTNTCTGASSSRYTITYVAGTQTVSNGSLTVTAPTVNRTYGAPNPALTPTYTGFVNGDTASSLSTQPTCSTTATATSPVGDYPITCSGGVSDRYTLTYVAGTLHVTPALLTVTASSPSSTYGAVNLTVTASYSGFQNGETTSVLTHQPTCSTTATASSNAGTYPTTCTGATAANYATLTVDGTLTVAPAPLTVTAPNATRAYGAANPTITPQYSGFVSGQNASVLTSPATCQANAGTAANVGSYPTSCSGAAAANYAISYVNGTLTVTQAPLTVNAPSVARLYGDANPVFAPTYAGFVNGDGPSAVGTAPACTSSAGPATHVGTYAVTCSGGASQNYALSYSPGTLTINQATLTVTASNATRAYGGANPAITPSYAGFKGSDTAAVVSQLTCTANASASSPVDTYPTMCSGGDAQDYTFVYSNGTLTVTPAALQITAPNLTRAYGDANPTVTPLYSGFVAGDTPAALSQAPTCVANAVPTSTVGGSYTTSCSGAAATNYTISYASGMLTITKATLNVTAPSPGRVYGQANPALTPSYSGFANGETASALSTAPTCTTTATQASHVGTYPVTCSGGAAVNYALTYVGGTLSIGPAVLTVTPNSASRTYGAANPTFGFTYSGFQNGDTAATALTTPPTCTSQYGTPAADVGAYDITCSGAVAKDNNHDGTADYVFSYGHATLTINPAPVTVKAPSATRQYGTPNPVFTPTYTGLQNGQTALTSAPSCTSTATATSAPGTYPIHCTPTGANPNYLVGFGPDGTLTVTKASTVLTQTPVSLIGTVLAFQVRYTAVLKSASGASLSGETVTFSTTNTSISGAGCTAVTDATGTATCTSGLLTVLNVVLSGSTIATFAGDSNYNPTSNTTAFTLN